MIVKRLFDIVFSLLTVLLLCWLLVICYVICCLETKSNGLFFQKRIGQFGKPFVIYKLKTMHPQTGTVTFFGAFFRKYKLDELPQLFNVLLGDMSIVGPRPDVAGYYDQLVGEERKILELKPGITSLASIKYRNEDGILEKQSHPLDYNDTVIFPDKVQLNLDYYYQQSFFLDLKIILKTVMSYRL